MRLDKYLKVARILKRRTVSKELAENQRCSINGRIAKPASDVKPGDIVEVIYGERKLTIRVLETKEIIHKDDASSLYEVLQEEKIAE